MAESRQSAHTRSGHRSRLTGYFFIRPAPNGFSMSQTAAVSGNPARIEDDGETLEQLLNG